VFGRIWSSARWTLWNTYAPQSDRWETMHPDGSGRRVVSGVAGLELALQGCGDPLMDDHVLVLDGGSVVAVPLTASGQSWFVRKSPLTSALCVAGQADSIVVTGLLNGVPAIAVHEREAEAGDDSERAGFWQVLLLDWSWGVLEPKFLRGHLVVSAPAEAITTGTVPQQTFESAGAVYLLHKQAAEWQIQERIVAAEPRDFGLFGFSVQATEKDLYVNQLLAAEGAVLGMPWVCRTPLTCTPSDPSCGYTTSRPSKPKPTEPPSPCRE
jgi:hypothetical protein